MSKDMPPPGDLPRWCEWHQSAPGKGIVRRFCDASYSHVEEFITSNPEIQRRSNDGPSASAFCPSLLEVLQRDKHTKPYLDCDWSFSAFPNLTDSQVAEYVESIHNAAHSLLREALVRTLGNTEAAGEVEIGMLVFGSKRPGKKWSLHMVWNVINLDKDLQYALPNGGAAKQFAIDLRAELMRRHGTELRDLIDIQPYAQNPGSTYQFRCAGASKGCEPASRLDIYDDGMLEPIRSLAPDDRISLWRASLVQYFGDVPQTLTYAECQGTGTKKPRVVLSGSRTFAQTGNIKGIGDVMLTTSMLKASFEEEAASCIQEYIHWYTETVERPHALRLDPYARKPQSIYKVEINVWRGFANWTSCSGLCHTKLQRCGDSGGSKLHSRNNVWYSLLYCHNQLKQRCRNTQCEDWRAARDLSRVTVPDLPDARGLLARAQQLMGAPRPTHDCAVAPAPSRSAAVPSSPLPASPGASSDARVTDELLCTTLEAGPSGHSNACLRAARGEPWQGHTDLLQQLIRAAPPAAQLACVLSSNRVPLPRGKTKGVRFICKSLVLWADLRGQAWLTGRQISELTAPARVWFLCWNTALVPLAQSGVKVEPGVVPVLPAPSIEQRVPCSVNTPEWFSSQRQIRRSGETVSRSPATFFHTHAFPYEFANTSYLFRCALELVPVVKKQSARMTDTLRIAALVMSVLYAPRSCAALADMAASSSQPIAQLDAGAEARVERHFREKDARCVKLGKKWAEVWEEGGVGATSMHLKALFAMIHGLLIGFGSSSQ